MRVVKASSETRPDAATSPAKGEKGSRFARILNEKRQEPSVQANVLAESQERGGSPLDSISSRTERSTGAPALPQAEQLAAEIVSHISASETAGGQKVEIQFNSQTLAGLLVHVRADQGAVSINFIAPAPRISHLLKSGLSDLRSSLERRGVRVAQVRVSGRIE